MTKPEQSIAHGLDCLRRLASEALERTPEGQRSAFAETLLNQLNEVATGLAPPPRPLSTAEKVGAGRQGRVMATSERQMKREGVENERYWLAPNARRHDHPHRRLA